MEYREEKAWGVTDLSRKFVMQHLPRVGKIVKIVCFVEDGAQWVSFVGEDGDKITVSGFTWGYSGTGPTGLYRMAEVLGFDLPRDIIGSQPQEEGWEVEKGD